MALASLPPRPCLSYRRHTLGISQRKLAHALGLSFQQIQRYENGTDRIGAGRLQQLSQVLQAPAAFFFQGAPNLSVGCSREPKIESSPVRLMRFLSTREGAALVRAFMRLDVKLRWRIVNLVQTLADFGRLRAYRRQDPTRSSQPHFQPPRSGVRRRTTAAQRCQVRLRSPHLS